MTELFVLRPTISPWGDYGEILQHGIANIVDGRLALERTGPFVPAISFPPPGIVVTDATKQALALCRFTGLEFNEVVKRRIVRVDWHQWNADNDAPAVYPDGGEPENYVHGQRHDAALADTLGALWEVSMRESPGLQIEGSSEIDLAHYGGQDLVQGSRWGYKYVTPRLRAWLESNVGDWVRFERCKVHGAA